MIASFASNCGKDSPTKSNKQALRVTDINGNTYKIVIIGNQEWMAENLKVTHFSDGIAIPKITDNSDWELTNTAAYCNYDNNAINADTCGSLYNWYAVDDSRNIAPEGWHVPTDEEWTTLNNYLGSDAGDKLKSIAGWNSDGNGTDDYGFTALPAGYRRSNGSFRSMGNQEFFWSASEENGSDYAWYRYLDYSSADITRTRFYKEHGFSVRCVRD